MLFGKTCITRFGTLQGLIGFLAVALVLGQLLLTPALVAERTAHAQSADNSKGNGQTQQAKTSQPYSTQPTGTITGTYSYFVPVVANQSASGDTTYLTLQNTGSVGASGAAGTMSANVSITYFDNSGSKLNASASNSLAPFAQWQPANPFAQGQADGSAEIDSNQPLVVIISMVTPKGNGSYIVPVAASAYGGEDLPVFSYGAAGITTRYNFYNPQSYPLTAYLYINSQYGKVNSTGGAFNQTFEFKFIIPAHQIYIFDPSTNPTPLPQGAVNVPPVAQGYYGYAHIGGLNGTTTGSATSPIYLTTLMQEYRQSDNFSTFFDYNGLANYQSTKLYIPAVFKNAFGGFYTGMTFTPGSITDGNVVINITFYDQTGKSVLAMSSPNVYYESQYNLYTGNISGLPDGFAGSAVATITTPDNTNPTSYVVVNEEGPATTNGPARSGVYMGLANDYTSTGYQLPFPYNAPYTNQVTSLPVMANGAYGGFFTGLTVQNLLNQPVTFTLTYQNPDGSTLSGTTTKSYTLQPYASTFIYQGGSSENLPANWFGNAVVKVTTTLPTPAANGGGPYYAVAVQTNVQSSFGFYTYSMPGNVIE